MVTKSLSVGHVMNMVIMLLSVQKEKRNPKKDLDLEDVETTCMLMRKKRMNLIREKMEMNWDL